MSHLFEDDVVLQDLQGRPLAVVHSPTIGLLPDEVLVNIFYAHCDAATLRALWLVSQGVADVLWRHYSHETSVGGSPAARVCCPAPGGCHQLERVLPECGHLVCAKCVLSQTRSACVARGGSPIRSQWQMAHGRPHPRLR